MTELRTGHDRPAPLGNHSYPSRPDLTDALALVVRAPGFLYPTGHLNADGRWMEDPDDTAERFAPILADFAAEISQSLPDVIRTDHGPADPARYAYGALGRAGPYEAVAYVVQLAPEATEVANGIAGWIALGEWTVRMGRWWLRRVRGAPGSRPTSGGDGLVRSPRLVRAACAFHAAETIGAGRIGVPLSAYCRHFGGGSVDLPSGGELYHVTVPTDAGTLHYLTTGDLRPRDHFSVLGRDVTPLNLPDFGDYGASPMDGVGNFQFLPPIY